MLMRVLVIGGGISDEREVSLRSSKAVFDAINADLHQKEFYDWDGSEDWLAENAQRFDVAMPILHGIGGEDGQIQAILEKYNLKYVGSGVQASKLCMDKISTQKLLAENGVRVPAQAVVNHDEYLNHELSGGPHVLKPILGGSSLDTYLQRDDKLSDEQSSVVFTKYGKMILEELIEGDEVTVPVLDGYDLPLIAIIPPEGAFFDYENKYNGASQEIPAPDFIDASIQGAARSLSRKCHDIAGCRHLSRVDMILAENGEMYVLEINTMPGMTSQSLFPLAAKKAGLTWEQFVEYLIQLAKK